MFSTGFLKIAGVYSVQGPQGGIKPSSKPARISSPTPAPSFLKSVTGAKATTPFGRPLTGFGHRPKITSFLRHG